MRDIMFAVLFVPLLVMSLRNGFVAYLLWCWAGLVAIQYYLYGFMVGFAYVQLFAVIALLQFFLRKDPERQSYKPDRTSVLLILFTVHVVLCATFAFQGHPRNWEMATNMIKTTLLCVLMPLIITSRYRIHALVVVIAIAVSFHGVVDGLKFAASGGHHLARGIAKFGDNNIYAMVLIMVIPLLAYLYKHSAVKVVKYGFLALIPLIVFSVMASQSRGGLVCMVAVGLWFLFKSRRKFSGLLVVSVCIFLIFYFASDQWLARMQTIDNASEDSSLLGRIGAWHISTAIALQNPIFGGGPLSVEIGAVWSEFRNSQGLLGFLPMDLNGLPGRGRATHSIYFQALGDLGFVGFFIFIAIMINAFSTARSIVNLCKKVGADLNWAYSLAQMLSLSIFAYAVAGALLSAAYFDLPYVLFMLVQTLKLLVQKEYDKFAIQNNNFPGMSRTIPQKYS
jgi:probable O-glycosylation ligase (exosortase A-associated)